MKLQYTVTFNSGRAESNFGTFRDAMLFASTFAEEVFVWRRTPLYEWDKSVRSELVAHMWAGFHV
jgi:hypothetical protein